MIRFFRRAIHFGFASLRWWWRGKPRRSTMQVHDIFRDHCEPCVHYHPDLEECTVCECFVRESDLEQNKIVYATEHCPLGKW